MADATAVFKYGQYELAHVLTKSFDHYPVYDPSGTDYLYTRFVLRVQGVIHPGLNPVNTGETAAEALKRIEHDFLSPRQYLLYSQNGKVILEVPAGKDGLYIDAENGPKPKSFNVTMITQMSAMVEFTVEVCRINCSGAVAARRGYTSNRWSEAEEYDQNGYCTLTTRGLLICASDLRVNPDAIRDVVVPPIRRGYQRERSSYTLSEDGLRLAYSFTDREYYLGPPYPAKKASGRFIVVQGPGPWTAQCSVKLEGDKSTSKQYLMELALTIVRAKLKTIMPNEVDKDNKQIARTLRASFSEELYSNAIEVSFQTAINPEKLGNTVIGARTDMYGTELPGSPSRNQPGVAPSLRGNNQFLMLLHQTFDDPCVMTAALTSGGLTESILASGGGLPPLGEATLKASGGSIQDAVSRGEVAAASASAVASAQFQVQVAGATPPRPPGAGDIVASYSPRVLNLPPRQGTNPASIVVGKISEAAPVVASDDSDIPYEHYSIVLKYINQTGRTSLVSTLPNALAKEVKIHNPKLRLIAEWTAERIGVAPEIPDPCPGNDGNSQNCSNYVLEETGFGVQNIEPVANGGYLYSISGRYEYSVLNTALVPLAAPLPPFLVAEARDRTDAATGRLLANKKSIYEQQIAALDKKIADYQRQIEQLNAGLPSEVPAPGSEMYPSVAIQVLQIKTKEAIVIDLQRQKSELFNRMESELKAIGSIQTVRRREGDYILNKDLIWYRLKTVKPGPVFEDCECDGTEQGFEGVLTGSGTTQATLTGSPRQLPSP